MKTRKSIQLIVILSAALIGIACNLQTAGPNPAAQGIAATAAPEGTVLAPSSEASEAQPSPTWTLELTQTLTATFTPSLTPTFTITPVTMTAGQALSCVKGPDWKLYEWVAGIALGETVTLVARAVPEIPNYYVVRKSGGTECWAFGGSSAISGSVASLPVRDTPPLPTVSFVVNNQVYVALCTLFIRKAGDSSWGANRLAAAVDLSGEASVSITAGYYDVIVRDCPGHIMYEADNRPIGADDNYRILAVAADVGFTIQSNYMFTVCWIDVLAPGGSWQKLYSSSDGGGPILTSDRRDFTLRAGVYSTRITQCSHAVLPIGSLYVYPGIGVIFWG